MLAKLPGIQAGQRGASLLETMLAMALLSVVVSGVLAFFPKGFHQLRLQSSVGAATYLARQKVDYYMAQGYNTITGVPISLTEYLKGDGTDSIDNPSTSFSTQANFVRTASITINSTLNLYVVTIKIFRRHLTVAPGYNTSGDAPLAQIVTYIGNPGSPPP